MVLVPLFVGLSLVVSAHAADDVKHSGRIVAVQAAGRSITLEASTIPCRPWRPRYDRSDRAGTRACWTCSAPAVGSRASTCRSRIPIAEPRHIRSILPDPILEALSTAWVKRGADQEDFDTDRQGGLKEAWYGASAFGPLVESPEIYSECLEQQGWRAITLPPEEKDHS
jgi:hypothetical protein